MVFPPISYIGPGVPTCYGVIPIKSSPLPVPIGVHSGEKVLFPRPGPVSKQRVRASLSTIKSTNPVPYGASCPKITFSVIPVSVSCSPKKAASSRISVVSSKEHFLRGPLLTLLIPCLVIDVKIPL